MSCVGKVRAWIEQQGRREFVAAFRSAAVPDRLPATRVCPSPHQARAWIEKEASAIGASVEWAAGGTSGAEILSRGTNES
jgi:hypothetical protein